MHLFLNSDFWLQYISSREGSYYAKYMHIQYFLLSEYRLIFMELRLSAVTKPAQVTSGGMRERPIVLIIETFSFCSNKLPFKRKKERKKVRLISFYYIFKGHTFEYNSHFNICNTYRSNSK